MSDIPEAPDPAPRPPRQAIVMDPGDSPGVGVEHTLHYSGFVDFVPDAAPHQDGVVAIPFGIGGGQ